ncbi:hypothetical protein [Pseudomonas piscis]|uniref:hypothetical protein n=1 Tax=Pseudomonas piscis TaxID=2614538 RepID=UPI0021D5FD81|nr:hypothetical protein [Pseudomonas piscis]MCU7647394.1 hypothetical protein [Pseudomonas piscis]
MFSHRIQAPGQADLDLQVSTHLDASPQARLIVQFSSLQQYDRELLARLDALCARYGERLMVRFYSHHPGSAFDSRTLLALPSVHALSLDCLDTLEHFEAIASLSRLRHFELQVISADLPGLLALPNLRHLQTLRISLDKGPALDLAPIGQMLELHRLSISVQDHNLDVLGQCPGIHSLSLHRMPAKTPLGMVAGMAGLHSLSVSFGSRETMPELHHEQLRELDILRVRGLSQLDLGGFPQLQVLKIEDQAQLGRLDLRGCPQLQLLHLANLKALGEIKGLEGSQVSDLRLIRTPALDMLALLAGQLPPTVQYLKLFSGKRAVDKQIEARQQQLGIPAPRGPL